MLPEAKREMLQAWPYGWRGVGGLSGDGIECQWGITYSIRTRVWYTEIGTQKSLRKHKIHIKPQLSWDHHEEGKNLTNANSVSSPPYILRPPNLWFQVEVYYFSPRIHVLFSQTSGDQYFHWMNPSYTTDTIFQGAVWRFSLNVIWPGTEGNASGCECRVHRSEGGRDLYVV